MLPGEPVNSLLAFEQVSGRLPCPVHLLDLRVTRLAKAGVITEDQQQVGTLLDWLDMVPVGCRLRAFPMLPKRITAKRFKLFAYLRTP